MKQIITKSEAQTLALGKKLASRLKGGEVIALVGDLGAGKTVLARGLARGLGIKNTINSPTFVLMKLYRTPINADLTRTNADKDADQRRYPRESVFNPRESALGVGVNQRSNQRGSAIRWLVHVDAYRLSSGRELIDIGLKDWLGRKDSVVLIEWAERVKDILPEEIIKINLKVKSPTERLLAIVGI